MRVFFAAKIFTCLAVIIDFFRKLEKIVAVQHALQKAMALPENAPRYESQETKIVEKTLSPWRRICPQRLCSDLLDLVLSCELKFEKYCDDWIENEYHIDHSDDYIVS